MSPRPVPRRVQISWSTLREGENSAGAVRRIGLVGKQTTISNRNTLAPTSFLAESSPRFVLFHHAGSLHWLLLQTAYLGSLSCPGRTRSAFLQLLMNGCNTVTSGSPRKLFSFNDFARGVRTKVLTRGGPERYTAIHRGRSRRAGLAESPNGHVGGLSPEIVESAV